MTATPTLPGTIPGLLQLCSPVIVPGRGKGIVIDPYGERDTALVCGIGNCDLGVDWHLRINVALDLADLTGRAHAAWWLLGRLGTPNDVDRAIAKVTRVPHVSWRYIMDYAMLGRDMGAEDVDLLRRVVLHVAGVAS